MWHFAVERVGGVGAGVFRDGSSWTAHPKDLDMRHAIFAGPARLTTCCRLDELGLEVVRATL